MANLDTQVIADLLGTFYRVNHGWGTTASLADSGETAVPVSGGTAVTGIFDDGTIEGSDRGGPRWYCRATDGYAIGRYLTVTGGSTYQIDSISPDGDGRVFECMLSVRT